MLALYAKSMKKLLTIYDSFEVDNKGTVAIGRNEGEVQIEIGSTVKIVTPDKKEFILEVLGVETFTKCFTSATQLGVLFGNQIAAQDIPKESELWH